MNTKLTNILLTILLIFNVAFLGFWWYGHIKMHHQKREMEVQTATILDKSKGERFLLKTLGFDTNQKMKLDNLMEVHKKFLDKFMSENTRLQCNFFQALMKNTDSVSTSRIADSMGMLKVHPEKELFMHFNNIKRICNKEQTQKFNDLMDNMSKEFIQRQIAHNNWRTKQDSL